MQMYIRYFQQFKCSLRLGRRNLIRVTAVSFPDRCTGCCVLANCGCTHTAASFCISGITTQQPACSELLVLDTLPKYALCRIFCEPGCSVFVCVCVRMHINFCVFSLVDRAFVVELFVAVNKRS